MASNPGAEGLIAPEGDHVRLSHDGRVSHRYGSAVKRYERVDMRNARC